MHLGHTDNDISTSNRVHLLTDLYFCIKSVVTDNEKRVGAGSIDPVRIRRPFAVYTIWRQKVFYRQVPILYGSGF